MPVIQLKRGLVANKPATAAAGEPVYTTDTQNLYFGTGASVVPLKIDASNVTNLPAGGAVSSVFGRTGAVVAATNDYSFSQISGTASAGQIPSLDASKITTGTLSAALLPTIDGGTF